MRVIHWGLAFVMCSMAMMMLGCAAQGQKPTAAAERRDKTITEGAVVGGVAGAVIGAATGGDRTAIAVGATLGAIAGAGAGAYIDQRQQAAAAREASLDELIAGERGEVKQLEHMVRTEQEKLTNKRRDVAAVKRQLAISKKNAEAARQLQAQADAIRQDLALYDRAINATAKGLEVSRTNLAAYQNRNPGADTQALALAIAARQKGQGQLKQIRGSNADLLASIDKQSNAR